MLLSDAPWLLPLTFVVLFLYVVALNALAKRATAALAAGKHDTAIRLYTLLLRLMPGRAQFVYLRGVVRALKGDHNEAFADFRRAVRLNPSLGDAYLASAMTYMYRGEYDQALADLDRAAAVEPENLQISLTRAGVFTRQGDLTAALEECDRALKAAEARTEVIRAGTPYTSGANPRLAETLAAGQVAVVSMRADCYRRLGREHEAAADRIRVLKTPPADIPDALVSRASANYHLGRYQQSLDDNSEAIKRAPAFYIAYINRAECHLALGNTFQALEDLERAAAIFPNFEITSADTALALYAARRPEDAAALWDSLLARDPRHADLDWVSAEYNWAPPLVELGRAFLAECRPDLSPAGT